MGVWVAGVAAGVVVVGGRQGIGLLVLSRRVPVVLWGHGGHCHGRPASGGGGGGLEVVVVDVAVAVGRGQRSRWGWVMPVLLGGGGCVGGTLWLSLWG